MRYYYLTLALLVALPMTVRAQAIEHWIVGEYDYSRDGGLLADTSGSNADTFDLSTTPVPTGAHILRAYVQVIDSLDSAFHGDSSTIAINVGSTTIRPAKEFRGGSGWLPAEGIYPADSSLVLDGTLGRPAVLADRGKLSMILEKWPLNKGRMKVFLWYLVP
jgi:hypothetical protein